MSTIMGSAGTTRQAGAAAGPMWKDFLYIAAEGWYDEAFPVRVPHRTLRSVEDA